jgi:hypothetical protein
MKHKSTRNDLTKGYTPVPMDTVPREIPAGFVLMHNHVQHNTRTRSGTRGFRGWFQPAPWPDFMPCNCGWSGLPHYAKPRSEAGG